MHDTVFSLEMKFSLIVHADCGVYFGTSKWEALFCVFISLDEFSLLLDNCV